MEIMEVAKKIADDEESAGTCKPWDCLKLIPPTLFAPPNRLAG